MWDIFLAYVVSCLGSAVIDEKDNFVQARKDATQIVANLQRQQVQSRLIASDYLEANFDLLDTLVAG